jgi:dTMP kinase
LYSPALVPDSVAYLNVEGRQLALRNFEKSATLDYWESGMDLGLDRDMFESFLKYQRRLAREFERMQKRYGFEIVDGNRGIEQIQRDLRSYVGTTLGVA